MNLSVKTLTCLKQETAAEHIKSKLFEAIMAATYGNTPPALIVMGDRFHDNLLLACGRQYGNIEEFSGIPVIRDKMIFNSSVAMVMIWDRESLPEPLLFASSLVTLVRSPEPAITVKFT
jgi:hypothetical protein